MREMFICGFEKNAISVKLVQKAIKARTKGKPILSGFSDVFMKHKSKSPTMNLVEREAAKRAIREVQRVSPNTARKTLPKLESTLASTEKEIEQHLREKDYAKEYSEIDNYIKENNPFKKLSFIKGFEKRAATKKELAQEDLAKGGLMAVGGGYAVSKAKDPLMGRYTVYHGTQPGNVASIQSEGLKASKGGKGVSSSFRGQMGDATKDWAHGKTYFTSSKSLAYDHTGKLEPSIFGARASGQSRKGIVEMSLPYHMWDKAKADPEYASIIGKGGRGSASSHEEFKKNMESTVKEMGDNPIVKRMAAYYEGDIAPKYIRGGKDFWKTQFREMKHLPSYIKAHPLRFGLGTALLGGGAYAAQQGVRNAVSAAQQLREGN